MVVQGNQGTTKVTPWPVLGQQARRAASSCGRYEPRVPEICWRWRRRTHNAGRKKMGPGQERTTRRIGLVKKGVKACSLCTIQLLADSAWGLGRSAVPAYPRGNKSLSMLHDFPNDSPRQGCACLMLQRRGNLRFFWCLRVKPSPVREPLVLGLDLNQPRITPAHRARKGENTNGTTTQGAHGPRSRWVSGCALCAPLKYSEKQIRGTMRG